MQVLFLNIVEPRLSRSRGWICGAETPWTQGESAFRRSRQIMIRTDHLLSRDVRSRIFHARAIRYRV